jgi:hypothetical protein
VSVNFYDNSAIMVGFDTHLFMAGPKPDGVPTPWIYIAAAPFLQPPATFHKRTGQVRSDGWQMIQQNFDLYLVVHVPAPGLPPAPTQGLNWARIILMASSKAKMVVHSVSGQGAPLATCLAAGAGLNLNCAEPASLPVGAVLCVNSVKTSPTLGDYLGAALGAMVDAALGFALKKTLKFTGITGVGDAIVKHIYRRRTDILRIIMPPIVAKAADPATQIQRWLQELVDGK